MLDELFEMFGRDGKRGRAAGERGGARGFFARMFGGDDDHDTRRIRYDEDDARRERYRDDEDDDDRSGRRRHRRDHDRFDFGD